MNIKKRIVLLCVSFFMGSLCFAQSILDSNVLSKVLSSVFEIVVEKPGEGNLEYEKDLPFSRVAFSIRNDKYLPLGTAFLMDDGRFFSAAHVFMLSQKTVYNDYFLRDNNGNLYKIDKITSFSTNRDFICFTVENFQPKSGSGLSKAEAIEMNTQVYSVGNALGDGIVIRNGVLTSQTYETENGEWKWLRFSAAASPGNSGGPLITAEGKLLGIITMKSENENLNYALPFEEINAIEPNLGLVTTSFYYTLPNIFSEKFYHKYSAEVELPLSLKEVQTQLTEGLTDYTTKLVNSLRKQFSPAGKQGFAIAQGKTELLTNFYMKYFPFTIYLSETGKWDFGYPGNIKTHNLADNGYLYFGEMMGYTMGLISKPESMSLEELVTSPKTYMDFMLSAKKITRTIAGEKIGITSFGEPCKSEQYVDLFGRTWLVSYWELPFADSMVLSYALPLPEGLYVMFTLDSTGDICCGHTLDMAFVADLVSPTYNGTLKNWKEYLALPETVVGKKSTPLSLFNLNYDEKGINLTTDVFSLTLPKDVIKSDDETRLRATFGYRFVEDTLVRENRFIDLYTNVRSDDYSYISLSKVKKPDADALKKTVEQWEQKRDGISPYNGEPYNYEQYTYLDNIIYPEGITYESRMDAEELYVLSTELLGQGRNEDIKKVWEKAAENIIDIK